MKYVDDETLKNIHKKLGMVYKQFRGCFYERRF